MNIIKRYISLWLLVVGSLSCSSSGQKTEIQNIEVVITGMNTWLNLMPGSPGKFFLQGEMTVKILADETLTDISIKNIKVYSREKLIFNFTPILELKYQDDQMTLRPGSSVEYRFGTDGGIRLGAVEIPDDKVDVIFSVSGGYGKYLVDLKDVYLERAY